MASENTIYFYPGQGGHSHSGENSSFIDTSKYSLFDFSWGFLGDPSRVSSQTMNYNSFQNFIVETINNAVLKPAGLILQPGTVNGDSDIISNSISTKLIAANAITANEIAANTITANQIAANTITANQIAAGAITADELTANIVLINNIIRSNNFDGTILSNGAITTAGTAGWAVSGQGQAVFDTTFIRGAIVAASVSTPGIDILSNGAISSANFNVTAGGDLTATNANITGQINATSGSIGNWDISAGNIISSDGKISLINDAGDTVIIAQSTVGVFAAINSNGSITLQNGSFGSSQVMNGVSYVVADSIGRTTTVQGSGIYGNLGYVGVNGINSSGPVYTGLSYLSSGDIYSTNTMTADGAMFSQYFIMSGGVTGTGSALIKRSDGYILVNSSRRELKSNIEDISNSLSKIDALRPRVFNWKSQPDDPDDIFHREIKTNHKTMGFVVEEVAETSPEYLEYRIAEDGTLDGHYWKANDFIALTIQGIKDLSAKVTSLEQRISQLEG